MKYLLKHSNGSVIGLIAIDDTVATPQGFEVITEQEYTQGLLAFKGEQFLLWDDQSRVFSQNSTLNNSYSSTVEKQSQLEQLRALSVDINLYDKLADTTTRDALQADFDALKDVVFPPA